MRDQDWALLGIAPTTELTAIKRAYASRLKVTRPDDDAEAYQALRTAYERALKWAEQQPQDPQSLSSWAHPIDGAPQAARLADQSSANQIDSAAAADDDLRHRPAPPLPSDYVARLIHLHRSQGNSSLEARWPEIEAMLVEQPLSRRADWSACFAKWVIDEPSLPMAFIDSLCLHFDWVDDYRVERQIGIGLAEPLQRAIQARAVQQAVAEQVGEPIAPEPPAPPSAEVLERVAIIERLVHRRLSARSQFWLAVLLRPTLMRLLRGLDRDTLSACGIDPLSQQVLRRVLSAAGRLRAALLFASLLAIFGAFAEEIRFVIFQMVIWAGISATWMALAHFLGLLMNHGLLLGPPGTPPLSRWRQHSLQPASGLCLLVLVAALTYGSARIGTTAGVLMNASTADSLHSLWSAFAWPMALTGAALAWPLSTWASQVSAGLLLALVVSTWPGVTGGSTHAGLFASVAVYVLAGVANYEGKLRAGRLFGAVFYPIAVTLKLTARWGWTFALMPGVLPLAALLAWKPPLHAMTLALVWTCVATCVYEFHHRGEAWALARLDRAG